MDREAYAGKLTGMEGKTLLPVLGRQDAATVRQLAHRFRFTLQELRQVSQAARDLEMWREGSLTVWWQTEAGEIGGTERHHKKMLLTRLADHVQTIAVQEKVYPAERLSDPSRRQVRLQERESDRQILGLCPAYSEATVCCGLHTLDAVRGCAFSCSYCTIQTFYGDTAELEANLAEKLSSLQLEAGRRYHIGTGQASDSLIWGNRSGVLDALLDFAASHPNVLLELKTKADNIGYLTRVDVPPNIVCSWTMNTEPVIRHEEVGAASLARRLQAARGLADRGVRVGFHFHPMVFYHGWREDYPDVAKRILGTFSAAEIAFVSMGSVTMIKPVMQEIRRRGGQSKILQMEMVRDHHGKLTYPDRVKLDLFRGLYSAFAPWHDRVFFYLCMETAEIWKQVFGYAYPENSVFEEHFLDHCLPSTATHPGSAAS